MLGKHRYRNILNRGWPDPGAASCVFEYDYPNNGDPSAHNWREHVALDATAPPGHFRDPYPAPTWTNRPSQLAGLVRPLPDSLPRTPSPPPSPVPVPLSATLNPDQQGDVERGEPGLFSRKRDETDKAAVKSPFSAPDSVKLEPSGHPTPSIKSEGPPAYYEPSQALRDEIARLNPSGPQAVVRVKEEQIFKREHGAADLIPPQSDLKKTPVDLSVAQSLRVKQEPRDVQSEIPAIGPSQALWNEWSRLQSQEQHHTGPATPIKREPGDPQPTAQPSTVRQSPRAAGSREHTLREQPPSFERIKREPTMGEDMQPMKRLKTEFK